MKKIILIPFAFTAIITGSSAVCIPYTCDASIIYAMEKQRETIRSRIGDLSNTIGSIDSEVDINKALITIESIELLHLKHRYFIRLYEQKKQTYELRNVSAMTDLNTALSVIKTNAILEDSEPFDLINSLNLMPTYNMEKQQDE